MPGKPTKTPGGLFDDGSLLGFLQSTLESMEQAAGGSLGEERAKLMELQAVLGGMNPRAAPPPPADELELAHQLDQLEDQLDTVAQQIATADNSTKTLLTQSAAAWAGSGSGASNPAASAANADSEDANGVSDVGGSSSSPAATSKDFGGSTAALSSSTAAMERLLATGLLPVAEQAEDDEAAAPKEATGPDGSKKTTS